MSGAWAFDFARPDGTGGFVRLELRPAEGVAWYWAYLVGPETGLVVVRDHEVPLPRVTNRLEVRADGLWAELHCETPGEHWSLGLEAFGLLLDAPADALAPGGEVGVRLAVGFDLEWEVGAGNDGRDCGRVVGELLVGRDRIAFEGPAVHEAHVHPTDWWGNGWRRAWPGLDPAVDRRPSAIVPLGRGAVLERALDREPLGWSERLLVTGGRRRGGGANPRMPGV